MSENFNWHNGNHINSVEKSEVSFGQRDHEFIFGLLSLNCIRKMGSQAKQEKLSSPEEHEGTKDTISKEY